MSDIKIYNGDCLEIMKDIPSKSVDMVLCDLPYGTTGLGWDDIIPFDKLWEFYKNIIKPSGVICLFGSEPFASKLRLSNEAMYRYDWVWEKNNCGNFQLVKQQPMKTHETISVFWNNFKDFAFSEIITSNMNRLGLPYSDVQKLFPSKNGKQTGWLSNKISGLELPTREQWEVLCNLFGIENEYDKLILTYNLELKDVDITLSNIGKNGRLGHISGCKNETYKQTKSGYPKSVLKFNREVGLHPTQKPVALLEYLIRIYTNEGETVLDNTMGSGSTGVACANTNRNFIGIELDEKYFKIAKKRIEEANNKLF
jgi:hypothetical protein